MKHLLYFILLQVWYHVQRMLQFILLHRLFYFLANETTPLSLAVRKEYDVGELEGHKFQHCYSYKANCTKHRMRSFIAIMFVYTVTPT